MRDIILKEKGYFILRVSQKNYNKYTKQKIIEECLRFIYENAQI